MSPEQILRKAAFMVRSADPSITIQEAESRIRNYTGFPSSPKDRDDSHKRLSWDDYFMSLAFLVAMRSPDAQTQHGCVIVDQNNKVISTGYNGWLQGASDEDMPNIRPKKYLHVIHSEVNAVLSAQQNLVGCRVYVTGPPCNECLKTMARVGIKEVIIGDRPHVFSEGYLELQSFICASQDIKIRKFTGTLASLDGRTISKESHESLQRTK